MIIVIVWLHHMKRIACMFLNYEVFAIVVVDITKIVYEIGLTYIFLPKWEFRICFRLFKYRGSNNLYMTTY
jgi:hypothetical protein